MAWCRLLTHRCQSMDQDAGGHEQDEEQHAQQVRGDMQIAVALQQPRQFTREGGQVGELNE